MMYYSVVWLDNVTTGSTADLPHLFCFAKTQNTRTWEQFTCPLCSRSPENTILCICVPVLSRNSGSHHMTECSTGICLYFLL